MKINRKNNAVSEIIGTMILLIIAISVVTLVFYTVLTNFNSDPNTIAEIVGKMENNFVVLEHKGGQSLSEDSTEVIFAIGGGRQPPIPLYDLTILRSDGSNGLDNGFWDIGEYIYYTDPSWSNSAVPPRIEVDIGDDITNSLVFIGTLVDVPAGKGAIWHFDECSPSLIAKDATGHQNTGYLLPPLHRPKWIDESLGAKKNCSLNFTHGSSVVNVYDSWFLDINDNLTIEAWMKPAKNVLVSDLEFDDQFGYNPRIIHIDDIIYAVVYQGKDVGSGDGYLKTIEIDISGDINETVIDTLAFGNGAPSELEPMIIHINGNIYGIVFKNKSNEATLKTVEIFPDGTINDIIKGSLILDTNTPNDEPDIIHVTDDIYAAVYSDKTKSILQTIKILPTGVINGEVDKQTFDNFVCADPELIHVNGDIFAIAYIKNPNKVTIRTVEINSEGIITTIPATFINQLIIEDDGADDPCIVHIDENVYAVTYSRRNGNYGDVATFTIDNDGQISDDINDSFTYDSVKCDDPNMIYNGDDLYLIAYTSSTPHTGYVITIQIQDDGTITKNVLNKYIYNEDQGYEPHLIQIEGNVYAIVYRGWSPHAGNLETINPYESMDPTTSGVVKQGAYGIYANLTDVFGFINNDQHTVSGKIGSISSIEGWYHIVMTYDQGNITLYCNNQTIDKEPYSSPIVDTIFSLKIGPQYFGLIDEIAIYDQVLEDRIRWQHFEHPGSMKYPL